VPPPYSPAGNCIYCGATSYRKDGSDSPLGEEHIIPRGIGGRLVLPQASCAECERITTTFEDKCIKGFYFSRSHLGISGRKAKRTAAKIPLIFHQVGKQFGTLINMPLEIHPGVVLTPRFKPAMMFAGDRFEDHEKYDVIGTELFSGAWNRLKALGNGNVFLAGKHGQNGVEYARLLAKIAHGFTCAELGTGNFVPVLGPIIRGEELPWNAVGSGLIIEPTSKNLHDISNETRILYDGREAIVTRI
jgi:hypothetical protein